MRLPLWLWPVLAALAAPAAAQPVKVEVVGEAGVYSLLRGGKPYVVKGAGVGGVDFATVAARGGNSVRTWGVEGAQEVLDAAARHGLTVALNLPVASERFGFDYDDEQAVAAQRERIEAIVRRYRAHPALLAWILGNELDFSHTNPRVYDAVNALSEAIHQLDPNHPTTTTTSTVDAELIVTIAKRAPSLDFLSVQLYGALVLLPRYADGLLADTPFMVTEWGPLGFWEVDKTAWDAPQEQNSTEKALHYLRGYQQHIAPLLPRQALGSYVFLWGQKQERTPTWFSMFTPSGQSTATVDVMQFAWTGRHPDNRAPVVKVVRLNGRRARTDVVLRPGRTYSAEARIRDPDGDDLTYAWSVKPESQSLAVGGDRELPMPDLPDLIAEPQSARVMVTTPTRPGPYRLFVTASDGKGHAAYANLPFFVRAAPP